MNFQNIEIADKDVTNVFNKELEKNNVIFAVIGVFIFFFWTFMDAMVVPELWLEFFIFRFLGFTSALFVTFNYKRFNLPSLVSIYYAALIISLVSMYVTCRVNESQLNFYVLGDLIFFVGVGMLATWELKYSLILVTLTVIFTAVVYNLLSEIDANKFVTQAAIPILSVSGISVIMVYSKFKSRFEQTKSRMELEKSLEIIKLKSRENNSLQLKLHENEKASIIGEITASISHELNTPLSIVVNGSKAIDEIIQEILGLMKNIQNEQWSDILVALELLHNREMSFPSIKQYQNAKLIEEKFLSSSKFEVEPFLARQLIECGFSEDDSILFDKIGKFENASEVLKLIVHIKKLTRFTYSLQNAVEKSSTIINEIKSLVDNNNSKEMKSIGINESLSSAFSLFLENKTKNIKYALNFSSEITIQGNEIRLLQMWFKLIDYIFSSNHYMTDVINVNVSVEQNVDKLLVRFHFNKPLANKTKDIELKKYSSIMEQSRVEKGKEFNLNILQSLFLEYNAEISLNDLNAEHEIIVQLPRVSF